MKPQDILIILKILIWKGSKWSIARLAESVGMSASETHAAIKRCEISGIYSPLTRMPIRSALEEFIIHGVKYAFPAEQAPPDRGMPTAHSAPPLSGMIAGGDEVYVWPYENGTVRGISISPLYSSVPFACEKDRELYEYLTLIDAIRIGRAREKKLAEELIIKMIEASGR